MRSGILHLLAGTAVAIALIGVTCQRAEEIRYRRQRYRDQDRPDRAVLGRRYSVYADIGKTQAAYMRMINEQGGINGRKINLIQYDDAYSPPKAVEQVRKLVEGDEVLLTFQIIGTAGERRRPEISQRQEGAAALRRHGRIEVHRSEELPMDDGLQPELLQSEGRIYGQYILKNHPNAKIGILYQNDDLGRDYVTGLKAGLGDKAATDDRRRNFL